MPCWTQVGAFNDLSLHLLRVPEKVLALSRPVEYVAAGAASAAAGDTGLPQV